MSPLVVCLMVASLGLALHAAMATREGAQGLAELGRAMLWCGLLVALLVYTGAAR